MGSSTSAKIFYGFSLMSKSDHDEVAYWVRRKFKKYDLDEEMDGPVDVLWVMVWEKEGVSHDNNWDRRWDAWDATGMKVVYHSYNQDSLAIKESIIETDDGGEEDFDPIKLADKSLTYYRQLKKFCEKYNIPWTEPSWSLVAYHG